MPYFENYNYEELKEKFVRNRFGEEQIYENPDIEDFLQEHRVVSQPFGEWSIQSPFIERLARKVETRHDAVNILRGCATPFVGLSNFERVIEGTGMARFMHMLDFLADDIHFYITSGDYALLAEPSMVFVRDIHGGTQALELYSSGTQLTKEISGDTILQLLYQEWDSQMPHWKDARQFLCDLLAEDLLEMRARAEDEFAEAIAVSEDGKDIIPMHGKIVVLSGHPRSVHGVRVYEKPAHLSFFQKNKILRSVIDKVSRPLPQNWWGWDEETQILVRDGSIFYTHEQFCPPSLPNIE